MSRLYFISKLKTNEFTVGVEKLNLLVIQESDFESYVGLCLTRLTPGVLLNVGLISGQQKHDMGLEAGIENVANN